MIEFLKVAAAWVAYIISFPALMIAFLGPIVALLVSFFIFIPIIYLIFEEIFPDSSYAGIIGIILFSLYVLACGYMYPWAAMVLNK